MKVHTILHLLHLQHLIVGVMLENYLLQEVKSLFMFNVLADLHGGYPSVWRELLPAIITLQVSLDKLHDDCLVNAGHAIQLFAHCQSHFDASAVWFGPNKSSIKQLQFIQALDLLQANC